MSDIRDRAPDAGVWSDHGAPVADKIRAATDAARRDAGPRVDLPALENIRAALAFRGAFAPPDGWITGTEGHLSFHGQRSDFALADLPPDVAAEFLARWGAT